MPKTDLSGALLERLNRGDDAAIEQAFQIFETYLRVAVRRCLSPRLRAKFDSVDIVQSIWVDVLQGLRRRRWHFADAAHLRAFLLKATRNRLLNWAEHHRVCPEDAMGNDVHQHPAPASEPEPSQLAQAHELWQRMLAVCPPGHRELLRLKREGCTASQIAERTGLHSSSVHRIMYDLMRRFAGLRRGMPGLLRLPDRAL